MSSFSMQGIPARYRTRRDSEPKSWYAKKERPFYGGVPRIRPKFYRRRRFFVLLGFFIIVAYFVLPYFGHKTPTAATAVDAGDDSDETFIARLRDPRRNGYTSLTPTQKQAKIRDTFSQSWSAYKVSAWGKDEFYPRTKGSRFMVDGGLGWIIVDSLDTLALMGLKDELAIARDWVINTLTYDTDHDVNVFETTIRMLGGLLSAYHLTNDNAYLNKALDLGNRLLPAYKTATGIPTASINLHSGVPLESHDDGGASSTAEVTSLQLEMKYLSYLSGNAAYGDAAERVMEVVRQRPQTGGLVPIFIYPETGEWRGHLTRLGSRGDSYYEYLAKQWLMFGDETYEQEWDTALAGIKHYLVRQTEPNKLSFVGELPDGVDGLLTGKMDHLVCFLPGTIALATTRGKTASRARHEAWWTRSHDENLALAEELTRSCFEMYNATVSGLAPEIAYFRMDPAHPGTTTDLPDISIEPADAHNLMRPETVESLFMLWTITGEEKYRQWSWQIYVAMERWMRVADDGGYTSLDSVLQIPPPQRDNMESFWLAETLKYLYLTFGSPYNLEKEIFNTEAHPLPIIGNWRPKDTTADKLAGAAVDSAETAGSSRKVVDPEHIRELKMKQIRRAALEVRARALGQGKNAKEASRIQKQKMDELLKTLTDEEVLRAAGEL
ncbi:mannosyl-oligosaccharide alpha-1,2-mannosidase [Savitreella phatthalungensis]